MVPMSIIHVNHIRSAIQKRFHALVDLSDVSQRPPDEIERFMLTRSLAAFAIAEMAEVDDQLAAASVVDGSTDNGIDAFYFDPVERVCYVVQSKFMQSGNGTMELGDVHKVLQGFRDLLDFKMERFGKLAAKHQLVAEALGDSRATFVLAFAYTGQQGLSNEAQSRIDDLLSSLNDGDELVSVRIINQKPLHDIVSAQALGESIDLTVMLHEFGKVQDPYRAYYGQLAVSDVVNWAQYGNRLYHRNIRGFKGSTDVNDAIVDTARNEPLHFWYFNNGITILCSELTKKPLGGDSRTSGVFECKGASVVNGAQTVGSLISTLGAGGTSESKEAKVLVRLISLEKCPPEFASDLTRAANTQNRIDKRDFASLDPQQARLRSELLLSFGKEYVYRSGDGQPTAEQGCTLDEATVALACAQSDVQLAVQAKREVGRLYDSVEQPPYTILFNASVSAQRLWRAVEIMRAVEAMLKELQAEAAGKDKLIAIHGNRLVLHLVLAELGSAVLDDSSIDPASVLERAKLLAPAVLQKVVAATLEKFPSAYPGNLFKNATKCKRLIESIRAKDGKGTPPRSKELTPADLRSLFDSPG